MDILNNLQIQDIKIIGQSSEKQIIFCYHEKHRRIICFDQHAVDERIRYERFLEGEKSTKNLAALKSKACRGAVKFGDELSLQRCQELIEELLECKVPFRCAHSRCNVSVLDSLDRQLYLDRTRDKLQIDIDTKSENEQ